MSGVMVAGVQGVRYCGAGITRSRCGCFNYYPIEVVGIVGVCGTVPMLDMAPYVPMTQTDDWPH